MKKPILIWEFYNSPKELRFEVDDVDFILAVPPRVEIPYKLQNLGCCSNYLYKVGKDGTVYNERGTEEASTWNKTEYKLNPDSSYIGWKIIIATHA